MNSLERASPCGGNPMFVFQEEAEEAKLIQPLTELKCRIEKLSILQCSSTEDRAREVMTIMDQAAMAFSSVRNPLEEEIDVNLSNWDSRICLGLKCYALVSRISQVARVVLTSLRSSDSKRTALQQLSNYCKELRIGEYPILLNIKRHVQEIGPAFAKDLMALQLEIEAESIWPNTYLGCLVNLLREGYQESIQLYLLELEIDWEEGVPAIGSIKSIYRTAFVLYVGGGASTGERINSLLEKIVCDLERRADPASVASLKEVGALARGLGLPVQESTLGDSTSSSLATGIS